MNLLAVYAGVSGLLYGLVQPVGLAVRDRPTGELSYVAGAPVLDNLHRFLLYTLASTWGWDTGRAITNVVAMLLVGRAVLVTLRRAARQAAFDAPVTFAGAPGQRGGRRARAGGERAGGSGAGPRRRRGTIEPMSNLELGRSTGWLSRERARLRP